jgi:hypothetical protein
MGASINIRFSTNLSEFSSAIQNQARQIKKLGAEMQSLGQALTIGVTAPIVAFGVASVLAFDQSAQAVAQVDAALKSTGGTVGYTSEQLQKMAADLQNVTTFDDDEILKKATANLLTFSKITGDTFQQAQKAALDLSTRLDGDLQGAAIQVGKALNDPIKGITALSRVGVSFSEGQKATIKSMMDTNNIAGAQSLILAELQKEFGGSAEAAANAGLGGFKQLGNIIGDLSEDFGKIILDAIQPFVEGIKSMALYLKDLSPEAKKTIAVVAGIAAAIGPLVFGIGGLISILPTLAAGFAVLTGPIGLTVAALAAVAYVVANNWDVVKQTLVDVANYFIDLYESSTVFRAGIEYVTLAFKTMWTQAKFAFNNIKAAAEFVVRNIFNYFSTLGKLIKAVLTLDGAGIKAALKEGFGGAKESVSTLFNDVKKNSIEAGKEVGQNISTAISNTLNGKKIARIKIAKESVDTKGVTEAITEAQKAAAEKAAADAEKAAAARKAAAKKAAEEEKRFNEELKKQGFSLKPVEQNNEVKNGSKAYFDAQIAVYRNFADNMATTAEQVKQAEQKIKEIEFSKALRFDPTSLIQISGGFDKLVTEMQAKANGLQSVANSMKATMVDLTDVVKSAIEGLAESAAVGFGEAIGGLVAGTTSMGEVMKGMLGMIANFMTSLGKSLIQASIAAIAFKKLIANPYAALAAGIALVALGAVVQSKFKEGPQGFADGGIVGGSSYYGDKIMARVNSAEMISNTDQQRRIWGAMNNSGGSQGGFVASTVLKGSDMLVVIERATERKNRKG